MLLLLLHLLLLLLLLRLRGYVVVQRREMDPGALRLTVGVRPPVPPLCPSDGDPVTASLFLLLLRHGERGGPVRVVDHGGDAGGGRVLARLVTAAAGGAPELQLVVGG